MSDIQILSGADGIKQAYHACLNLPNLDIVCLAGEYERVIGDYFDTQVAPKLYGKINTREILPDTPGNRAHAESKDGSINAVRFIDTGAGAESDMMLWNDGVVFISFGKTPVAVVVRESEIVKSLKLQFEALWQKLA